jgi:arylsulfatase A-like enzyme
MYRLPPWAKRTAAVILSLLDWTSTKREFCVGVKPDLPALQSAETHGGQSCFCTGLLKVGLPAAKEGSSDRDPTLAELLKPLGYATGQFGKNHVGDRNEYLPTVHGFDEFFGNLYHLNAEDEPENPDYPKNPEFLAKYGPRGVIRNFATDVDDPTEDPRFGRVGKQKIEDTGRLTKSAKRPWTKSSSPLR